MLNVVHGVFIKRKRKNKVFTFVSNLFAPRIVRVSPTTLRTIGTTLHNAATAQETAEEAIATATAQIATATKTLKKYGVL